MCAHGCTYRKFQITSLLQPNMAVRNRKEHPKKRSNANLNQERNGCPQMREQVALAVVSRPNIA